MKKIWLLIVVVLKITLPVDVGSNKIETFLLNKCKNYSKDAVTYDNVKKHNTQFLSYMHLTFSRLPQDKKQFCQRDSHILMHYMELLAKDVILCLPKDEKYLPKFFYVSFTEFMDFLCNDNAKNIDNFFSSVVQECIKTFEKVQAGQEIIQCFNETFALANGIVKQDDLCDDLVNAKKCLSRSLDKHCSSSSVPLKSLNYKFFSAIRKPCKTTSSHNTASSPAVKNLMLIILILWTSNMISHLTMII